jgi:hypothetical protein
MLTSAWCSEALPRSAAWWGHARGAPGHGTSPLHACSNNAILRARVWHGRAHHALKRMLPQSVWCSLFLPHMCMCGKATRMSLGAGVVLCGAGLIFPALGTVCS